MIKGFENHGFLKGKKNLSKRVASNHESGKEAALFCCPAVFHWVTRYKSTKQKGKKLLGMVIGLKHLSWYSLNHKNHERKDRMRAKVIALVNEKGGVGKSTSAATIGYILAQKKKKVLLIDFDGQGHASLLCGVRNINQLQETTATLLNRIICGEELPEAESFLHRHKGVDLIPSNSQLFALERNLSNADFRETKLQELTERFREQYEYILIDCMPNGGTTQINAMLSADELIIPTQAEVFSAVGMTQLARHSARIQKNTGRRLKIAGVLITMYDKRTSLSREVCGMLEEYKGIPIFKTRIPRSVKVGEAALYGQTISEYAPNHPAALAYEALVKELTENE